MARHDLEARFAEAVRLEPMLARDESLVIGLSGGPDSVALLHLLVGLNQQEGFALRLHVAHLNHRLRGSDSEADAEFVGTQARALRLPCSIEAVDIAEQARQAGESIEQTGREQRMRFFERVCPQAGAAAVALAHHADDQAETVLHRIIRGTGLRGLVGIRPVRPLREGSSIRLIRPLLGFRRAEIEAYLADRGLAFRSDASNRSDLYTRNRIRHEVLPLLRERINPQVEEALLRLAEQARSVDEYLTETGQRMLEALLIEEGGGQLVVHGPGLARKPRALQLQLVRQALLRVGMPEADLTYAHLSAVADLAAGQEGSKTLHLPDGVRVTRSYERLILEVASASPAAPEAGDLETRVPLEGTTVLPGRQYELTAELTACDEPAVTAFLHARTDRGPRCCEEWIDADRVAPPLVARFRRPGDRFLPLGMGGVKKVSEFFIDLKVEAQQRERTVVLCDQLGPVWVVPFRIDERVRLTRATRRVLRLRVRPVGEGGAPAGE